MVRYHQPVTTTAGSASLQLTCRIDNTGREPWETIGYQIYDPDTGLFIQEGEWIALGEAVAAGSSFDLRCDLQLPEESGRYRIYLSPMSREGQWLYASGSPMLVVDAEVRDGSVVRQQVEVTTLRRLRWRSVGPALRRVLTGPFTEVRAHRSLIRSMVRREILARYRGSLGDVSWTILHPALMMLTYFFVFGVVLQSRFGNDPSRSGFALYFLAGMIPWLAFAEPVARSPHTVLEHRSFVKKLVFPVGILPVNLVVSGCFTGLVALLLFLPAVALLRGGLPWTALALPVLVIPQILFTLGLCWMLAATGVLLRDLTQIIGFVLTLWFFLTPICYPETSLPVSLIPVLAQNPMFQVVRGYRQVLLEGVLPSPVMLVKLWALCIVVFFTGYAWFARWRRSFPDIV